VPDVITANYRIRSNPPSQNRTGHYGPPLTRGCSGPGQVEACGVGDREPCGFGESGRGSPQARASTPPLSGADRADPGLLVAARRGLYCGIRRRSVTARPRSTARVAVDGCVCRVLTLSATGGATSPTASTRLYARFRDGFVPVVAPVALWLQGLGDWRQTSKRGTR
jgi:hypothetical protein